MYIVAADVIAVGTKDSAAMLEMRARIASAERARTGCDRRLDELRGVSSVVRQSGVTSELLEIVATRER